MSKKNLNSVKIGVLKRWKHYLSNSKSNKAWTLENNQQLLNLHTTYLNKWKQIANNFVGKTGGQVKNQFFNIIRTLLRKAFKSCFQSKETTFVAEIKPKVLSEIANTRIDQFVPMDCVFCGMTIKEFLVQYVNGAFENESNSGQAKNLISMIKTFIKFEKCSN